MKTNFKFMEWKNFWFSISIAIIVVGFSLIAYRLIVQKPALNFGIDFTGGSSMILTFDQFSNPAVNEKVVKKDKEITSAFLSQIRQVLAEFKMENSSIQVSDKKEILIKSFVVDNNLRSTIIKRLAEKIGPLELLEADSIGPSIGNQLKQKSLCIIFLVLIAMLIYIAWRFDFVFGTAATISLVHDALVLIALAAIFSIEVDTAFVAAVLTILGYSMNDTVVVFDRIRENLKLTKIKQKLNLKEITNLSINQTLNRTLKTSVATMFFVITLLLFGGTTIKSFCLVLFLGIIVGTYSSIFIASPVMVMFSGNEPQK